MTDRELLDLPTAALATPCVQCGAPVEEDREVYAQPTCHACLPPPDPLPPLRPTSTPRCSCGMVTCWLYDELYNDWSPARCWRCLEIASMKVGHSDPLLYSLLPWDTDTCDRFLELVLSDTHLLPRHEVRAIAIVKDTSRDKWKVGP